ncbi:hypothetical protein SADUNF_Sadunf16G0226500 [Salix dunnii]|uniref:Uncharacterized protein n=1 Tax=Salix dunnii TaxID=1413687 RepID=A0A835MHQ8_9ROSI|nr:hypothetical protein SADUNF_Sadunf16G0226500 [Salix dunnii]
MAESEKLMALKKAYADIILNTAKEAANRVMESERKALRYHNDLCNSKDEALRLLLRLKQMIDAKTIEAEMTSSRQQSKIDELEAQLQEAEGVIIDLREELRWLRDELEKVRNSQGQPSNGKVVKENKSSHQNLTSEPIRLSLTNSSPQTVATSDVKGAPLDQRNFNNKCCNTTEDIDQLTILPLENYSSHNADLAAIMMTNKEPELYRNGCTQRIRASEGNLFASKLTTPGVVAEEQSLIKNEVITKASNMDEGKCAVSSPKTKALEKMDFLGEEGQKRVKVCPSRRRKSRSAKAKVKRKSCLNVKKPYQPPSIVSRCKMNLVNGAVKSDGRSGTLLPVKPCNMAMKNLSEVEEKLQETNDCLATEMIVPEGKRPRTEQSTQSISTSSTFPLVQHSEFCQPSSVLTQCKTYPLLLHDNVKSNEDQSKVTENYVKLKPLPRLDPGLTLIRGDMDSISGSKNVKVSVKALCRSGVAQTDANKDIEDVDDLVKEDCDSNQNLASPSYESDAQMVNVPLVYSNLEDSKTSEETTVSVMLVHSDIKVAKSSMQPNVFPGQSDNRPLKYTFQRKHKKEALSSPDNNSSVEKSNLKRKVEENQEYSPEAQKSSLINELSGDNCRLAQVACQERNSNDRSLAEQSEIQPGVDRAEPKPTVEPNPAGIEPYLLPASFLQPCLSASAPHPRPPFSMSIVPQELCSHLLT